MSMDPQPDVRVGFAGKQPAARLEFVSWLRVWESANKWLINHLWFVAIRSD